jgi:hypothetical protein
MDGNGEMDLGQGGAQQYFGRASWARECKNCINEKQRLGKKAFDDFRFTSSDRSLRKGPKLGEGNKSPGTETGGFDNSYWITFLLEIYAYSSKSRRWPKSRVSFRGGTERRDEINGTFLQYERMRDAQRIIMTSQEFLA